MISQKRLMELLHYEPSTGVFTRKVLSGGQLPGSVAGSIDAYGYLCIALDRKTYKAHRLAWLYMHGVWPELDLDHKNQVKTDNRISNLREVTKQKNTWNSTPARRNNAVGFRGVNVSGKSFQASIGVNGKKQYLGLFPTPELAHAAYLAAKRRLHAVE